VTTEARASEAAPEAPASFEEQFAQRLDQLPRGDRAILRRNAGRTLAESRGVMPIFFRIFRGLPAEEEIYFLVATLHATNRAGGTPGNFAATMRALSRSASGDDPVDRRMRLLLDATFDLLDGYKPGGGELAFRLRQCTKLAGSRGVGVDWIQLIKDLRGWGHPDRYVQKRWARSYFGAPARPEND